MDRLDPAAPVLVAPEEGVPMWEFPDHAAFRAWWDADAEGRKALPSPRVVGVYPPEAGLFDDEEGEG